MLNDDVAEKNFEPESDLTDQLPMSDQEKIVFLEKQLKVRLF